MRVYLYDIYVLLVLHMLKAKTRYLRVTQSTSHAR